MNERINCKDCIYFNRFAAGHTELGYCQIDPPVIVPLLGNKNGQFPIMNAETGWCGSAVRQETNVTSKMEEWIFKT